MFAIRDAPKYMKRILKYILVKVPTNSIFSVYHKNTVKSSKKLVARKKIKCYNKKVYINKLTI